MRVFALGITVATLLVAAAHTAQAINCEQVRRYAQTGRTAEDIAESMIVDVSEVKKCLGAKESGAATPALKEPEKK